jgi:phosphatidylglycerophosphate synthase
MAGEAVTTSTTSQGSPGSARPLRPRELQDPLNFYIYHPLSWQLARRLARTAITPNTVSVFGGLCVIAAAFVYAQQIWPISAALGMLLHMSWHVFDGADGDLARLTGKSSPLGEMVDGLCDYLSHVVLYLVLGWMLHLTIGTTAWWWMAVAGISHAIQSNHVEVQRRQYQWWMFGTPWLRHTHNGADSVTNKSGFGSLVTAYLGLASGMTPFALQIDAATAAAHGDPVRLEKIRVAVRREAPPLLFICKLLGPNPRAIVLGFAMLLAMRSGMGPLWYFAYQAVALNALLVASVAMHNAAAKRIAARIGV